MKKETIQQKTEDVSEENLVRLFEAKEEGKSFPDALVLAGISDSERDIAPLRTLWDMHSELMRMSHNISPRKSLLTSALTALSTQSEEGVTTSPQKGYNESGKHGLIIHIIHNIETMSQMNWKIVAPIAVFVLAVVAVVSLGNDASPASPTENNASRSASALAPTSGDAESVTSPEVISTKSAVSAPVSGEVDDLASALTLDAGTDLALFNDSTGDISLVTADSQSINDLSTAYDETTF